MDVGDGGWSSDRERMSMKDTSPVRPSKKPGPSDLIQ